MSIAIIPARGGSKRLPRKNILPFLGRPMITWTIHAALESNKFDRVVVSTEDDEISSVARSCGAEVAIREPDLASDRAGLIDVVQACIAEITDFPDSFCLLLANCPLRTATDIQRAHDAFVSKNVPALLSVVDFGWTPPFRALSPSPKGLEFIMETGMQKSQGYPDAVCPTGAMYWAKTSAMAGASSLYVEGLMPFEMPWHRGVDIDTEYDFELATCLGFADEKGFRFEGDKL